ncbi:MAG: LPS export ABC transporter permease LptG [Candidatus Thiodiazotropha sp.]|nr:LPS export ABC transporter permease LptG [Candidatus Thiodiazotropha sp.]MCM8882356.1 LPS export ABC transporter permease LptG [Candidatus Thiodiazotropha sp.]MCM8920397.1 LPS export ABC transporter permease LptG [Candidatus Thiodiazotropha sp.]
MISLFDRYIGGAVLAGVVAVLALLLVLIGFFELVSELEEVERGYTTAMAYTYVLLGMPRYSYELFPLATLLGSLIGLGILAGNSELMAMRAAGVSITRIVISVLKAGLLVLSVVVLVGEYLAPQAEQQAQRMKMEALSDQITLKTRYGFWSRDGNTFINIRQILPDAQLADISIYEYGEDARLHRAIHAERAHYQLDGWVMQEVEQSDFSTEQIRVNSIPSQVWKTQLEPSTLDVLTVKPHMLAAWDLWRYIDYLKNNGQAAVNYEVAFWGKLTAPLVTLVMLFLSIPFVFGSLRSVSIGQRIFVGAMLGIVFYLLNRAFSYMAVVYSMNAFFAACFPLLLFLTLAIWMFRRIR